MQHFCKASFDAASRRHWCNSKSDGASVSEKKKKKKKHKNDASECVERKCSNAGKCRAKVSVNRFTWSIASVQKAALRRVRKIPAPIKIKLALPNRPQKKPKIPRFETRHFMGMGVLLQKEPKIPDAHKTSAAISGSKIAGQRILRTWGLF